MVYVLTQYMERRKNQWLTSTVALLPLRVRKKIYRIFLFFKSLLEWLSSWIISGASNLNSQAYIQNESQWNGFLNSSVMVRICCHCTPYCRPSYFKSKRKKLLHNFKRCLPLKTGFELHSRQGSQGAAAADSESYSTGRQAATAVTVVHPLHVTACQSPNANAFALQRKIRKSTSTMTFWDATGSRPIFWPWAGGQIWDGAACQPTCTTKTAGQNKNYCGITQLTGRLPRAGSHGTQLPPGRPQAVLARALIGITGPWDGHQILHK